MGFCVVASSSATALKNNCSLLFKDGKKLLNNANGEEEK
jgi:hypothetical protein